MLSIRLTPLPLRYITRGYAAQSSHHDADSNIERKSDDYRPGTDNYAYENPWPKLNKGRLDGLFQDGWRRPLAKDQGAKMVRSMLTHSFTPKIKNQKRDFPWKKSLFSRFD